MIQRRRNPQNHHDGCHRYPDPTLRATARGLGTGTITNSENGNTALDDMEREGNEDTTGDEGEVNPAKKKAQEMLTSLGPLVSFFFLF